MIETEALRARDKSNASFFLDANLISLSNPRRGKITILMLIFFRFLKLLLL